MRKLLFFVVALLLGFSQIHAQVTDTIWTETHGGTNCDIATQIVETCDGGYIITGYSPSTDGDVFANKGGNDYWAVRLTPRGDTLWTKTYGSPNDEKAWAVQTTQDCGFIHVGDQSKDCPDVDCGECAGSINSLTMIYTGNGTNVTVVAFEDKAEAGYELATFTNVNYGDTLTAVSGTGSDGTFAGNNALFSVNGDNDHATVAHTSCSDDIYAGSVLSAQFKVGAGNSVDGGPFCPAPDCGDCNGSINSLEMVYTGSGVNVTIVAFEDKAEAGYELATFNNVNTGDILPVVYGTGTNGAFEGNNALFSINGDDPNATAVHTSCSDEILAGTVINADWTVNSGTSTEGGPFCEAPPCGECDGGINSLRMVYTGSGTNVTIVAYEDKAEAGYELQTFNNVNTGDTLATVSGTDTDNKFAGNNALFSIDGDDVNATEVHTSCSDDIYAGTLLNADWTVGDGTSVDGGKFCPAPPCGECGGGINLLQMVYNGAATNATIVVYEDKAEAGYELATFTNVYPGDTLPAVSGTDSDSKFAGNNAYFAVNGDTDNAANAHTSCSDDIFVGTRIGEFTVAFGTSVDGGPFCDDPATGGGDGCSDCDGGINALEMKYLGTATNATITVYDGSTDPGDLAHTFTNVNPGDTISFTGSGSDNKMESNVYIVENGNVAGAVDIHTSCSVDIYLGTTFVGLWEVAGGSSVKGGAFCYSPSEAGCEECDGGITFLSMKYLGTATNATVKVYQGGTDPADLTHTFTNVNPDDIISFYGYGSSNLLEKNVYITVDDLNETNIHTSCSVDIYIGTVFNTIWQITDGASQKGGTFCAITNGGCSDCDGGINYLAVRYIGSDTNATIRVYEKEIDPAYLLGTFTGIYNGDIVSFTGGQSDNKFDGNNAILTVNGNDGGAIFIHTSCSDDIFVNTIIDGLYKVTDGSSVDGGGLCEIDESTCDECQGGLQWLTMEYTGSATNATVEVYEKEVHVDNLLDTFTGVNNGSLLTFNGTKSGGAFDGATVIMRITPNDDTEISTDCSPTIYAGTVIGDWTVSAGYSKDGGNLCPIDPNQCDVCDGGINYLSMNFRGPEVNATITVYEDQIDPSSLLHTFTNVNKGNILSFHGTDTYGTFAGNAAILVVNGDAGSAVEIHTSCSDDIYKGSILGVTYNWQVDAGTSVDGGNLCVEPCGDCANGVTKLSLIYRGGEENATITVYEKEVHVDELLDTFTDISFGDTITFNGTKSGGKFDGDVAYISVNGDDANALEILTDCSVETAVGSYFGDWKVAGGRSKDGGPLCPVADADCGDRDVYIVSTYGNSNQKWEVTYGGTGDDYARSVKQTLDGGFIVAGFTNSDDGDVTGYQGGYDYWVLKLDSDGMLEWQKTLGGFGDDQASEVLETRDGEYVVAGYSNSTNGDVSANKGGYDFWVVKLDGTGNIIWEKSIGGTNDDKAYGLSKSLYGGFIVAGSSESSDGDVPSNAGGTDMVAAVIDNDGNIEFVKVEGTAENEEARSVSYTADGGFVMAGDQVVSGTGGSTDYIVFKIKADGTTEWTRSYGGSSDDHGRSVFQHTDGSYVITGFSESYDGDVFGNQGCNDYYTVKLDNGTLDPTNPTECFSVCLMDSNGDLIALTGDPDVDPILEYRENSGAGWQIAPVVNPSMWCIDTEKATVVLRLSYNNSQQKILSVPTDVDFCFETVLVTVQLTAPDCTTPTYDDGLVEYGGLNGYQLFGNTGLTGESGTGIIQMEMLPVPTTFNMIWKGIVGRVEWQDLATNQLVTFCTKEVCVELEDSNGDPIDGAKAYYNGHGWKYMGETGDSEPGKVCEIMLADAVAPYDEVNFRILWDCGKMIERFDFTTPDPAVWTVQTVEVTALFIGTDGNPKAGADIYYRKRCTQFMGTSGSNGDEVTREMLPAPYKFWAEYAGKEAVANQNVGINPIVKLRERSLKSEFADGNNEVDIATFPNPLSNSTTIAFSNPTTQNIVVAVFDMSGRQVATLHDGNLIDGNHKFTWDASNNENGIYILRVITQDGAFHSNMVKY